MLKDVVCNILIYNSKVVNDLGDLLGIEWIGEQL